MKPERWREIERLCQRALEMEPEKREAYLKGVCAADESLLKEVEALLVNQSEAEGFMRQPAMEAAAKVLAREQENLPEQDLIGRTVSHYRIIDRLGRGGMGEVFLAEDTSLNRKVALKFLPPEMQQDAVAHKRLLREAHSAAALDHPYICHINEVCESDGRDFIVMEYVDGQTLKERLAKGPLPLKEMIQIANEVSEALEDAHEKRIVHRDLKPANIMLTRKGHAKVMDFGLAKHVIPPGGIESQEESVTALTRSGMTLGTLAYMSPEQLRGEAVDARSDIFSFGIVLYEMLAGVHPFKKDTGMDTAGAILKDFPQPIGELRPDIPFLLQHMVKKMLAKDPQDRYPSIHDVRTDVKELLEGSNGPAPGERRRSKPLYWVATAALVVAGAGIFLRFFSGRDAPPPKYKPVTTSGSIKRYPSFSPDGNWIAFTWVGEKKDNLDIYIKELDGPGISRLTTDPAADCCAAWSPDGRQIAFVRYSSGHRDLYLTSPLGGGERRIGEISKVVTDEIATVGLTGFGTLSWSPDGKSIAFSDRDSPKNPPSIWLLSLESLEKKRMTAPNPSYLGDGIPAFSPDGRHLAFIRQFEWPRSSIYRMDLPSGEPKLVTDHQHPLEQCWTSDSREIVFSNLSGMGEVGLWRVFAEGGEPRRVATRGESIRQPVIARNRLAYVSDTVNMEIWRQELTGQEATNPPSKPLFSSSSSEGDMCISPDGSRIAYTSDSSGTLEIWISNADGTKPNQLTDMNAGSTGSPTWSPDGKNIAFDSTKSGNGDIYLMSVEGGPVRKITTDPSEEVVPQFSRDGRWIYFGSNRSGSWQVWKVPSEGGSAVQITRGGGCWSRESSDGYVYYHGYLDRQKRGIWRVPVSGGPETLVLDRALSPTRWDLADRGIYFVDTRTRPRAICFYDFANRLTSNLISVNREPGFVISAGFSVAPNGKWLLYCGGFRTSDIMMIDNFR